LSNSNTLLFNNDPVADFCIQLGQAILIFRWQYLPKQKTYFSKFEASTEKIHIFSIIKFQTDKLLFLRCLFLQKKSSGVLSEKIKQLSLIEV